MHNTLVGISKWIVRHSKIRHNQLLIYILQLWLCEHLKTMKGKENTLFDKAHRPDPSSVPRFVKWNLMKLNRALRKKDVSTLEAKEVIIEKPNEHSQYCSQYTSVTFILLKIWHYIMRNYQYTSMTMIH